MKLYYFPGSCALAPHIVLEWLGVAFEPVRITKGDPEYLKVNPLGVVPALEHGGKLYTQADAILHWLAESHPEGRLGSDGSPDDAYELNNWMAFLTGDLHPAFFPFFGPQRYTTSDDDEALAAVRAASQVRVGTFFDYMNKRLDGRDYLVGERRSIADAYAIPMLRWGRMLDRKLAEYPALDAFLSRWEADDGVQRALKEQGLLK